MLVCFIFFMALSVLEINLFRVILCLLYLVFGAFLCSQGLGSALYGNLTFVLVLLPESLHWEPD